MSVYIFSAHNVIGSFRNIASLPSTQLMFPTPDLSHLSKADYEHVYEPAEDTFILLDALEADQDALTQLKPRICLEIGSGSGCVSAFVAKMLGPSCVYFCTDINARAAAFTASTGRQNSVALDAVLGSLHTPFASRCSGKIDILIFNPPYVPTLDDEEKCGQDAASIAAAWAGGHLGMTATNALLEVVPSLLAPNGQFYLVAIQQNNPAAIVKQMAKSGLQGRLVLKRRAGGEVLFVLSFTRAASI